MSDCITTGVFNMEPTVHSIQNIHFTQITRKINTNPNIREKAISNTQSGGHD